MRDDLYLIPANSKKGQLIFNVFRSIDLTIFITGITLSIIIFIIIEDNSLLSTIIKIIPISLGSFLVIPIANYHNVLEFLKDAWLFIMNRRVYKWKGWCVRNEYGEEK